MTYSIHKSIDISFAHHIRGHKGHCINMHGHTWKFEVGLMSEELDAQGFVLDFSTLKTKLLEPIHSLLDHALAIGEDTYNDIADDLEPMGVKLLASRQELHGEINTSEREVVRFEQAENRYPGGLKVAVFPFSPTSERFSKWLYDAARATLEDDRVKIRYARIFETLHPVESVAEYWPVKSSGES
ncbi:MAG: 6-carboxytetrahydropterin synthase [Myxococcota bacterium]|jgi:6-pyruvoyltetrahydropterin/6-carboxytetrahydropterin synthase|nr:6-carboxytetrahydropterin synthase [Myxococcota bacterium]